MALTSPYSNNSTKKSLDTDVGFKISKPGYDAARSAGSNLVFSSSWPSLPIAFETTITNPLGGGTNTSAVLHNLKFPPLTMVWFYGPDPSGVGNVSLRIVMPVSDTNVYLTNISLTQPQSTFIATATKVNIKCFQVDLSQDLDYKLAPGETFKTPYDPDFGVKVVKQNKDINSRDLRDFSVHSRAQSPLILAVKTEQTIPTANIGTGIGNVVQYTSPFTSPVWVYGYIKIGTTIAGNLSIPVGSYLPAPYYSQGYPRTFTDGLISYIGYTSNDTGATLVILRDPMFAATQTTVLY